MITRDEASRIAALAKIDLTGNERDRVAAELGAILAFVEQIAGIDTHNVDIDNEIRAVPALREDVPSPSLPAAETFANAPDADRDARLFRVPRVLGA